MLVPLAPPEAFSLMDHIRSLPSERQERIHAKLAEAKSLLVSHGLWDRLIELGESSAGPDDDSLDPINHDYYALRTPCPFLEEEMCSIYEDRPSACRELLVTSPAEQCLDMSKNPIDPIPAPLRIGSILALLWGDLTESPPRLIPLVIVADWVDRHQGENQRVFDGPKLLDAALDKMWRFLSLAFQQQSACSTHGDNEG
jgi:hypothetical protein